MLIRDAIARHDPTRFQFFVCYLCEWRAPRYREELERLGATVLALSKWKSLAALALDLTIPFRIVGLLDDLAIDVFEVHLYLSLLPAVASRWIARRCPTLYVLHARRQGLPAPVYPLLRLLAPWFDAFAIGDGFRPELRAIGVPDDRMWMTRSGGSFHEIDEWGDRPSEIWREFGIPEGAPVVLHVSRLHDSKEQYRLLQAFARVRVLVPEAWLIIVGDGPAEARLRGMACALGIADRAIFPGFRADLPNFYKGARVYAVPGLQEGMGLATLMALASGLPAIAFDVGNLHRVVSNGRTGALVPPSDPDRFTSELARFLTLSADEMARYAQAARTLVRSLYSVDAFVSDREALYAALLQHRNAPRIVASASDSRR